MRVFNCYFRSVTRLRLSVLALTVLVNATQDSQVREQREEIAQASRPALETRVAPKDTPAPAPATNGSFSSGGGSDRAGGKVSRTRGIHSSRRPEQGFEDAPLPPDLPDIPLPIGSLPSFTFQLPAPTPVAKQTSGVQSTFANVRPTAADVRPAVADVRPTVTDIRQTVADIRPTATAKGEFALAQPLTLATASSVSSPAQEFSFSVPAQVTELQPVSQRTVPAEQGKAGMRKKAEMPAGPAVPASQLVMQGSVMDVLGRKDAAKEVAPEPANVRSSGGKAAPKKSETSRMRRAVGRLLPLQKPYRGSPSLRPAPGAVRRARSATPSRTSSAPPVNSGQLSPRPLLRRPLRDLRPRRPPLRAPPRALGTCSGRLPPPGSVTRAWCATRPRPNAAAPARPPGCPRPRAVPLGVRVGMKLEAHDRKDPQLVCVATLADVAPESGRFLVHFDGWDSAYDYWADPGSPWVHPVHWAKEHGHTLTPPSGHKGPFSWDKYLSETKATAVPGRLFRPRQLCPGWRRGLRLEAVDPLNPRLVRVATVASLQPPQGLLLHWDGWPPGPAGDCFVDEDSPDIHPAGWCAKTGHPLEPPPNHPVGANALPGTCPTPGCTGLGHVKGPMFATHHSAYGCPYSKENLERDGPVPDRLHGTDPGPGAKAPDAEVSTAPPADTKDGLRRCPTPGCNGSGHLNQKYSVHHKASGCPLAERSAQGDDSSQDSVQSTAAPPQAPRGRGRPRKNKVPPTPTSNGPQKVSKVEGSAATNTLHRCVHQSVFCTPGGTASAPPSAPPPAPPPGPEKSVCWEQHSRLLSHLDLVSGAVVAGWSVAQVATFIGSLPGCQATAKIFRDEQIDGEALLLLGQGDLVRTLRLKLGPALKLALGQHRHHSRHRNDTAAGLMVDRATKDVGAPGAAQGTIWTATTLYRMERQLAQIKDHMESSHLLETVQSNKVAASRALSKELK
ncbi:lethal(3)malignant brain tumor-like protein 1 [Ixodes scapularis]